MEQKRKFNRWYVDEATDFSVSLSDGKQPVRVLDISAGGVKVSSAKRMEVGSIVYGELRIPSPDNAVVSQIGPFHIKGKVMRVSGEKGKWEAVVAFDKVSWQPLNA